MDCAIRIVFKKFSETFQQYLHFYNANRTFPTQTISKTIMCPLQATLSSLGKCIFILFNKILLFKKISANIPESFIIFERRVIVQFREEKKNVDNFFAYIKQQVISVFKIYKIY